MTRRMVLQQAIQRLEDAGIEAARRNAEWLLMAVFSCSRVDLLTRLDQAVSPEAAARLEAMVQRRLQHEPLQYVIGATEFFGLPIRVTPAVLIPRPETEEVTEHALTLLQEVKNPRVLDIGTGSGCIALAVKHRRPDARVTACDVSASALAVALENAEALGLDVSLVEADALSPDFAARFDPAFDLVISNPPYVPPEEAGALAPEVHDHEPHLALFSSSDALQFYHAIAGHVPHLLREEGWLVFETHTDYGDAVRVLLESSGLSDVFLRTDMNGRSRIVGGRWK